MPNERNNTTLSGQPRIEESYGVREALDDYGPVSNFMRWYNENVMGKPAHDDEIPLMPPGLGGLGFDVLGNEPDRKTQQQLIEEERKAFEEIRKRRQFKDSTMNNLIDGDDIMDFDFQSAKKDTQMAKTQPGDLVIPAELQGLNPELYQAFRAGLFMEGIDPDEFTSGSAKVKINPVTGEEQYFLNKIAKAVKKTVKKVASNPIGRTLINVGAATLSGGNPYVIGATNALTAKAAGANDTTALMSGLGAGFGSSMMNKAAGGTGMLSKIAPTGTVGNALSSTSTGFGSSITNALKGGGLNALSSLAGSGNLGMTLANNVMGTSLGALAGAQLGGGLGSMAGMMLSPQPMQAMPDMAAAMQQNAQQLPNVATGGTLPYNTAVNYQYAPQMQIPYFNPMMGGRGGPSYVSGGMNNRGQMMNFASNMFGNRLAENSRRSGLSGFGQGITFY